MLLKLKGKIEFSPEDKTRKHKSQSSWKRVAMIKTNCDLDRYYAWFLEKRFNLKLNRNLRGAHITFISDKLDKTLFDQASKIFNGKEIDFYLDLEPRTNGEHWWLRVYCVDAENIREALGLTREPYFSFHLTLGYANEKNLEFSEYIMRQCKMFNLISNEPRKPFDQHEIIDMYE
jgi:hypothetical protein